MDKLNCTQAQAADPEDYISEEPHGGLRIGYFFPLRVEKNVRLLALHLTSLKEELNRIHARVGLAWASIEGMANMSKTLKKDIYVLIKRITPLKLSWDLCSNQMVKSENVEQFCKNLRLNIRCKTVLSQGIYGKLSMECNRLHNTLQDKHYEKVCASHPGPVYRHIAERSGRRCNQMGIHKSSA